MTDRTFKKIELLSNWFIFAMADTSFVSVHPLSYNISVSTREDTNDIGKSSRKYFFDGKFMIVRSRNYAIGLDV